MTWQSHQLPGEVPGARWPAALLLDPHPPTCRFGHMEEGNAQVCTAAQGRALPPLQACLQLRITSTAPCGALRVQLRIAAMYAACIVAAMQLRFGTAPSEELK